jgi:CDGSH-type Zn-finger protein
MGRRLPYDWMEDNMSDQLETPGVVIKVRENGSLLVEGPVRLVDADGNEWDVSDKARFSLCRCGASQRKPFCDGSHRGIAFEACERAPVVVQPES